MTILSEPTMNKKETLYPILLAVSLVHLINDSLQAVIPASYPILRDTLGLSYTQLGVITFILYFSSSVMQPVVGMYSDRRPSPLLLPIGMAIALLGMLCLAVSPGYLAVLGSVILVGAASAMFHPEGARIAYLAAGNRRGLAQSIFQVGGNTGSALAPVMTALIFYPFGQLGALWFTLVAAIGVVIQLKLAGWYRGYLSDSGRKIESKVNQHTDKGHWKHVRLAVGIIILIVFLRSWYGAGLSNYFVFYLMEKFRISIPEAQWYIFVYVGAGIAGTFLGGPLSDRIGRKRVILLSLLGASPFAILLPYANELWAYPLLFILGLINHSSFSVTVVYVQELVPGQVGTVSGLITGLAFGMGAIGAVAIGGLIDLTDLTLVILCSSFLPLFGIIGLLLPSDSKNRDRPQRAEVGQ